MSDEPESSPIPVIPTEEVDLLIGCGEVLLEEMLSPKAGIRRPPILLELLLKDGQAYHKYATASGLTAEAFVDGPEDFSDVLLNGALFILDKLRSEGSLLLGSRAVPPDPPAILALVACLAAHHFIEGHACRFSDLRCVISLFTSTLTGLKGLLEPIQALSQGPDALLTWSWQSTPFAPSRSELGLTQRALDLLRFSELNPPTEPTEPRRDTRRFPWEGEDHKRSTPVVLESKDLPKLADVALTPDLAEEMAFLAALLKQEPSAAPVMLFHGPPGTGKTLSAKALAGETGRPLRTTSIPGIMNKWVGDSEHNLVDAFSEASSSGAILLLDEADALLLDRSRAYMGWEFLLVDTLLKLLEETPVPVILCTNLLTSMDPALMRRVHHLLAFPMPGSMERRAIWALELAHNGLGEEFDLDALAQVPITGGLISNAALQAARRGRILGDLFSVTTKSLLDLAAAETLKMSGAGEHRVVGFGGRNNGAGESSKEVVLLPSSRPDPAQRNQSHSRRSAS